MNIPNQLKNTITKRFDKRALINDLRAIETAYVEIAFTQGSNEVLIMQPRSQKYINHIAKN